MRTFALAITIGLLALIAAPTTRGQPKIKRNFQVTDPASGITVKVLATGEILTATDKDGKDVWRTDLPKETGIPRRDFPFVDDLRMRDGQVQMLGGGKPIGRVDPKTGKVTQFNPVAKK